MLLQTEFGLWNDRLRDLVLAEGLEFLDERAKHGDSPAEYRRDENCVRMCPTLVGYSRFWVLLHELGHHLSGASDQVWIEGDLGVTEAVADHIAIDALARLGCPTWGPQHHLNAMLGHFPTAVGADIRHAAMIAEAVGKLVAACRG